MGTLRGVENLVSWLYQFDVELGCSLHAVIWPVWDLAQRGCVALLVLRRSLWWVDCCVVDISGAPCRSNF